MAPIKIDAVPTVKRRIEYLLFLFGMKSNFPCGFLFLKLTTPEIIGNVKYLFPNVIETIILSTTMYHETKQISTHLFMNRITYIC